MAITLNTPSELASFSSSYAFHNLGGIDRSVHVFALPPVHLTELRWDMKFDADYRDASLNIHLAMANATRAAVRDLSCRCRITGPGPKRGVLASWDMDLGELAPGESAQEKSVRVANPAKWNDEQPNLYTLSLELRQDGKHLERIERTIGFREVVVRDGQLCVNGRRVKLAGVNRHETDPLTGRAATACHALEDARLLKNANFNYVRTSHYPPTEEFLDACDRIGLYVECEAPFCWARGGHGEDDPALAKAFLTPTAAMLDAHRHHPSIILWSIANESGNGPDGKNALSENFATTMQYCQSHDPSRPALFNNEWARDGGRGDIAVLHYPPWPPENCDFVKGDARPILIDEYFPPQTFTFAETLKRNPGLDVVNWPTGQNSPDSLWNHVYASKQVIGGAIWAGIDEEFYLPDGKTAGYGVWGFLDVWRRPKSLWWDAKCMYSPVWIPTRRVEWQPGQEIVRIPIENRHAFTDLGELRIRWELGGERGRCRLHAGPQTQTTLDIRVPDSTKAGSLLVIRFFDAKARLIAAHGITLGDKPVPVTPLPEAGCPKWEMSEESIRVEGRAFRMAIDRSSAAVSGKAIRLQHMPALFVTRLEERNVFNPGGAPYAEFPDAATRVIDRVQAEVRGNALAIVVKDRYSGFEGATELLIDREGQCTASYDYRYSGEAFSIGEQGLRFSMSEACTEIRWRRQSEWDVYPEDHIGRPEGHASACSPAGMRPAGVRPLCPWHLDANEYGTRDFRAAKYNIYDAALTAPDASGLRVDADGSVDVRACLAEHGVLLHVLRSRTPASASLPWPYSPAAARLETAGRLTGMFSVHFLLPECRESGGHSKD